MDIDARSNGIYSTLSPSLVVPSHFFCNESSTLVAIYDEPLGQETDGMTLIFPGDVPGSSPQRVVPKRVGTRTLVFSTPVYIAANHGMVEVLPVLGLASGEVELPPFRIGLKHPIRNVMELCINHSTNEAVLPVLISLMVHCDDDKKVGCKHFQDPHIDRIMATLVGSRTPGSSTSIKDILLPSRKWRRMNLTNFGREFGLREMEKQAYLLKTERLRWVKRKRKIFRAETMAKHVHVPRPDYENMTGSLPLPRKRYGQGQVDGDKEVPVDVWRLMQNAEWVCTVVEDYQPSEPGHLTLKTGQKVYIISQVVDGMCYGVCDGECGYFPQTHLHYLRTVKKFSKHNATIESQALLSESNVLEGQPITDENELRQPPKPTYANVRLGSESEPNATIGPRPLRSESNVMAGQPITDESELRQPPKYTYTNVDLGSESEHNASIGPRALRSESNVMAGQPITDDSELKQLPKYTTNVRLGSESEFSDPGTSTGSLPQLSEMRERSKAVCLHRLNLGQYGLNLPDAVLNRRSAPHLEPTDLPSKMKVFPIPDFQHYWTNNYLDPIPTSPLSPLARHAHKVKTELKKQVFVYEDSTSETSESDNDSDPTPEEPSQAGPSQQQHAVRGNKSSQTVPSPVSSCPHDEEHLTASSSHPRHKAKAMGVPVLPVAAFPNSKGLGEADSGWSSAVPSTDTEVKTMPQDDADL